MGFIEAAAAVLGLGAGAMNSSRQNAIAQDSLEYQKERDAQNLAFQRETYEKNYNNMLQMQEYEKEMAREAWVREDTATQRRAADLKAAGINPLLAAGSSASSMAPARVSTPQAQAPQRDGGDPYAGKMRASENQAVMISNALNLMRMKADISKTAAETRLIDAQRESALNDVSFKTRTLDDRVATVMHHASIAGEDAVLRMYQGELAKIGVDRETVGLAIDKIKEQMAGFDLTEKQKNLIALDLAIDQAGYNLEKWRSFGLPTNAGADTFTRSGWAVDELIRGFQTKSKGK